MVPNWCEVERGWMGWEGSKRERREGKKQKLGKGKKEGMRRKQRMHKMHCGRMEGSKGGQSVCIFTMQNWMTGNELKKWGGWRCGENNVSPMKKSWHSFTFPLPWSNVIWPSLLLWHSRWWETQPSPCPRWFTSGSQCVIVGRCQCPVCILYPTLSLQVHHLPPTQCWVFMPFPFSPNSLATPWPLSPSVSPSPSSLLLPCVFFPFFAYLLSPTLPHSPS